jgi:hypothetical protein
MATRIVVQALAGATLSISAALPATYDSAGYNATTMVYTAIGEIENFGSHGGVKTITMHTPVDTAVVAKVGGSKDYGTMTLTIGNIPKGTGQLLLAGAFESNNHYSVKMTYPDGEIHYIDVLVSKFQYVDGAVNDVLKVTCDLALCRMPVVVPAP